MGGFALVADLLGCCFVIREAPRHARLDSESEAAFDAYIDALIGVIGHADRAEPLKDYCLGLLMPMERKSVEPLAAVTAPSRVAAKHQSLLHFVGQAPWSDATLLARVRDWVLPRIEDRAAWTDPGVDRRRHGLSQEGQALGGRSAPVLRPVGQAGQLSDCG